MKLTRRRFYTTLLGLGVSPYAYARWWERWHPQVVLRDIALPALPSELDGLRVVQLSDLHISKLNPVELMQKVVSMTQALNPDLVLITGDMVTDSSTDAYQLAPILAQLKPRLGMYVSMGNHDYWEGVTTVKDAMKKEGIQVLTNQGREIQDKGKSLLVAGLGSAWAGYADVSAISSKFWRRGLPTLLMAHEPDVAVTTQAAGLPVLQLSGHTHAGQVRFPWWGHVVTVPWGKKFVMGHYQLGETQLYVNRGIGCISHPVRMLAAPEITCFTLRATV
jgi:uncharacterized protein